MTDPALPDETERKRLEARLAALVSATSDVVYRMSADWSEMQPLDGHALVSGNDVAIRDWMERTLPADEHARVRAAIADAIACKAPFELEHRVVGPDGTERWTHSRAVPILDARGDILEWLGLARDVTAAKRAQDALLENERRFRSMFEQSTGGMGVADVSHLRDAQALQGSLAEQRQLALDAARLGWWQFDPATGMVTHDARYAQIYGLEGTGPRHVDEVSAVLHPEDAPRLWAAVEAAVQVDDPQPYAVEYRIRRPDGALRWLEARGIASFAGQGASRRVTSFVGTVADVTERRLAEEVLRENEARFRLMANASPATLWVTNPEGHCTFLSRQWSELTGQPMEESLGLGWTNMTHPEDRASAAKAFIDANAAQGEFRTEYRLRMADGSYRWAIDLGRPWFSETGEYAGMVGAVFDIDARKRAEEMLEDASRRKDAFLATLAHELRNPLAPISNALQAWPLLEQKPQEVRRLRDMMGRQVRQMVRLIDDLLDVSRITRGRIELRRERLDLGEALGAAVEALKPFIDAQRHALVLDLPDAPLHVDADPGRLVQVFGNLLHNAAKYTQAGGRIDLAAHRDGDHAIVVVRDNGVGIPRGMLDAVFEMFTQVDQSLSRSHGGLGIGLTLVKTLVELHGGTVSARSEGPGQGSTFVVRLPLASARGVVEAPTAGEDALPLPPAHRALVVDDVQPSADTLAWMLRGLGQSAQAVHDGAAALRAVEAFRPDVVFVDIAMPDMDGYEVARRIRERPGTTPVLVALTGYGQAGDRRRAMEAGFDQHLVKPTTVEALHRVLLAIPER